LILRGNSTGKFLRLAQIYIVEKSQHSPSLVICLSERLPEDCENLEDFDKFDFQNDEQQNFAGLFGDFVPSNKPTW
jgi:hypothetical protein